MAQYQEDNYTNEDIKQFLLRDFNSYDNKEKLNDIINQVLKKKRLYKMFTNGILYCTS